MSCYFIAHIDIHDEDEYSKYLARVDEVFEKFNGKYLAVDPTPEALEGDPRPGRVVLIEFPCKEDLLRWYRSPEYQAILRHRLAGAHCETVMVRGTD